MAFVLFNLLSRKYFCVEDGEVWFSECGDDAEFFRDTEVATVLSQHELNEADYEVIFV